MLANILFQGVGMTSERTRERMIQRLIDANVQNNLKIVDEVITLFSPIKIAWSQIPESAKQEAYEMQRQKRQVEI